MKSHSSELDEFLEVVSRVGAKFVVPGEWTIAPDRRTALARALSDADIMDLAVETDGLDDSLQWLVATVAALAKASPSVAYAVASRYVGQRALLASGASGSLPDATAALITDGSNEGVVPGLFPAEAAAVLEVDGRSISVVDVASRRSELATVTGLRDAQLRILRFDPAELAGSDTPSGLAAIRDFALLISAVAAGIAEAALNAAEAYAADRYQFGASISTFAGVRAILVDMRQRVASLSGLLDAALDTEGLAPAIETARVAGGTAVDVGLAAIQVHGGYGYIDEYPVATLMRDAISISARNVPYRVATSLLGDHRFGVVVPA